MGTIRIGGGVTGGGGGGSGIGEGGVCTSGSATSAVDELIDNFGGLFGELQDAQNYF